MAVHWLALMLSPECGYPKWFAFFMLPQNFFIFILFYDFYRKTYKKQPQPGNDDAIKVDLNNNAGAGESSKLKDKVPILNYDKTFSD